MESEEGIKKHKIGIYMVFTCCLLLESTGSIAVEVVRPWHAQTKKTLWTKAFDWHGTNFLYGVFGLLMALITENFLNKYTIQLFAMLLTIVQDIMLLICFLTMFKGPVYDINKFISIIEVFVAQIRSSTIKVIFCDQFCLPTEYHKMEKLILHMFWITALCKSLATYLSDFLKDHVNCLGQQNCMVLPSTIILMNDVAFVILLVISKKFSRIRPVDRNIVVRAFKCLASATLSKLTHKRSRSSTWVNYATEKHGEKLVREIKMIRGILIIGLASPIYFAFASQTNTFFRVQTMNMNAELLKNIDMEHYEILFECIMILLAVPFLAFVFFPTSKSFKALYTPLQRIGTALILAVLAVICSTALSGEIRKEVVHSLSGNCYLHLYNNINESLTVLKSPLIDHRFNIHAMDMYTKRIILHGKKTFDFYYLKNNNMHQIKITAIEQTVIGYYFSEEDNLVPFLDSHKKDTDQGYSKLRIILCSPRKLKYVMKGKGGEKTIKGSMNDISVQEVIYGKYVISVDNYKLEEITLRMGGIYALLVQDLNGTFVSKLITIVEPNKVHFLWQIPQYFFIVLSKTLFGISALELCFTQAPVNMNLTVFNIWQFYLRSGNLVVLLIEYLNTSSRILNLIFYTILLLTNVIIFICLALRYKYVIDPCLIDEQKDIDHFEANSKVQLLAANPTSSAIVKTMFL